jgi:hypothetical protein
MQEVMDLNDPDLRATPPPDADSAVRCDAPRPAGEDWSE